MNQLLIPSNIFFNGEVEFQEDILKQVSGENILLLMTESSLKRLSLEKWIKLLKSNTELTWISEVPANPTYKDIHRVLKQCGGKSFDGVIALGGGSVIDLAKSFVGLSYFMENGSFSEIDVLDSIKTKKYLKESMSIPIYAIPTTAGTGSEVTRWATVWDLDNIAKYSVDSEQLYPKKAYIVPEYTISMPKRLTLSTGLDAICQAVEAYWAKATNPVVRELSKASIKLLVEYLPKVLDDGTNLEYREKVALGSLFSGLAFSNTRTTACHSISYPLTMKFGIEHGLACIITLPEVMKINMPEIIEKEELFKALGVESPEELQNWLDRVSERIVDLRLRSFGIKEKDIDGLVDLSFTLGRMDNNPVNINKEDVKHILTKIM